jgi:hypothetical protein
MKNHMQAGGKKAELKKADRADGSIADAHEESFRLYKQDMVNIFISFFSKASW